MINSNNYIFNDDYLIITNKFFLFKFLLFLCQLEIIINDRITIK